MKLEVPVHAEAEPPLFRSRFGGLWVDRRDAHDVLAERLARGLVDEDDAALIAQYIDEGFVVLPGAVDDAVIDDYLEFFERSWDEAPPKICAYYQGKVHRVSRELYDEVAKVSCLHWYYRRAAEIIFPPAVLRFLTQIYDRPPVAFQSMSMRKGSQEPLHIDTGPLTLTEPMSMAASWVALEDVQPHSGEFQFVPGSHRVPELLHHGVTKGHNGDMEAYGRILARIREECDERGLKTEYFMAKKGDALIWHADLMHGGAMIEDPARTRMSFIAHFMPLGVMPTFYDFSGVNAIPYPNGGYCLDDFRKTARTGSNGATSSKRMKDHVPLRIRALARRQMDRIASIGS